MENILILVIHPLTQSLLLGEINVGSSKYVGPIHHLMGLNSRLVGLT